MPPNHTFPPTIKVPQYPSQNLPKINCPSYNFSPQPLLQRLVVQFPPLSSYVLHGSAHDYICDH